MGTCATKYGEGVRELGSPPARNQLVAELRTSKPSSVGENRVWRSASFQQRPYQLYPEGRLFGPRPYKPAYLQPPNLSPAKGVKICGVPAPTVPASQPYLACGARKSASRRLRGRPPVCNLSVIEGLSSPVREVKVSSPRDCRAKNSDTARTPAIQPASVQLPRKVSQASAGSPSTSCEDAFPHESTTIRDSAGFNWQALKYWKLNAAKNRAIRNPLFQSPFKSLFLSPLNECCCSNGGRAWRLCVTSVSTDLPQANFEVHQGSASFTTALWSSLQEKATEVLGAKSTLRLADIGISVVCKKGYKPNCPNNDGFFVSHIHGCTVCCVLDGHGPFGHDVCNVVQKNLIRLTTSNPALSSQPRRILQEAILRVHQDLTTNQSNLPLDSKLSGATVTIVVYLREQNKLVVAHVGNSRAVLCKLGKRGCGIRAIDLTVDHTPSSVTELRRIEKAGGQVRMPDGDGLHRVFLKNNSLPGLALARSIGDTLAESAGVIAMPDITGESAETIVTVDASQYKLDAKRDAFLLLCTDGVWNIMSSQEAIELAYFARRKGGQTAPEALARESWRRWIYQEQLFADDITALFMEFP
ncbi:hypothetical protein Esti_002201 [Eimeria stiedai]